MDTERKSPLCLKTDKDTEFKNSLFQVKCRKEYKIKLYASKNDDNKAAILKRFNGTLYQFACIIMYFTQVSICRRVIRLIALV